MSTPESGSPNLLDEFFSAAPTTGLAGDAAEGAATAPVEQAASEPSEDLEEAVEVDDVEAVAEDGLPPIPARRSLPPPAPSRRGVKRVASAPPPRGRSSARTSAPPPPPSLRATWPGIQDMDALAAGAPKLDQEPEPPFEAAVEAASSPAKLEPETTPGGFGSDGATDEETDAFFAGLEMPPSDSEDAKEAKAGSPEPSAETDMATALAASLSLRGDVPSGPSTEAAVASAEASPAEGASGSLDVFAELPRPPAVHAAAEGGESSAWPSPAKIDEWDDDWAPSLSALGAKEPDRAEAQGSSPSAQASTAKDDRAPFRLSLPPPPPPPLKRATLPLPRAPEARSHAAAAIFAVPDLANNETASPPDGASAEPAAAAEKEPSISIEVSPFGGVDDPSREDLTRPLPPTELARLAASEEGRSESELLRDDVTIPLPGYDSSDSEGSSRAILPDPYTSDTDLTRPLIPLGESGSEGPRSLILPPLRPPPDGSLEGDVRHIVAVPPPTVGTVEDAPTIQIASSGSEYTPTSQLQRPFSPTRTSPGLRGVLPPIPKPAPIPTDFGKRGPSASVAPVTGSVFPPFPPSGPARTRLLIGLAAVTFGVLALAIGLRSGSGSLVVTVAGPNGAAVPGVSVRVDGTERCNTAPCIIKDLKPGMHLVSAAASGLQPSAERAVVLESGEQVAHHVILSGEERSTAGLSVAAIGTGLHVMVDGREVGAPPVTLNDVTPGEHTVRILGPERYYQPYEEIVKLERGEVRSLGPVRLRVLRGRLELRAGAGSEGAAVAVDGRRIWHLPATIELSAEESHEVTAAKQGFSEMTQEIVFDGSAERAVTIAFGSDGSGTASAAPQVAYHSASSTNYAAPQRFASTAPRSTKMSLASTPEPAAATGTATLDITSTPPAAVVVNGRPLGTTPLHGVHVGAGKQTVLFVHPSLGRKVASANVAPGGRAAIGVKF